MSAFYQDEISKIDSQEKVFKSLKFHFTVRILRQKMLYTERRVKSHNIRTNINAGGHATTVQNNSLFCLLSIADV